MVREAEHWQTSAPGPFLTIVLPAGAVTVQSLGAERFRISAPDHDQEVVGFAAARARAHELAGGNDATA